MPLLHLGLFLVSREQRTRLTVKGRGRRHHNNSLHIACPLQSKPSPLAQERARLKTTVYLVTIDRVTSCKDDGFRQRATQYHIIIVHAILRGIRGTHSPPAFVLATHDPIREIFGAHFFPQVSSHERHAHQSPVHSRHAQMLR